MEPSDRASALVTTFITTQLHTDDADGSVTEYLAGVLNETVDVTGPMPEASTVDDLVEVVSMLLPDASPSAPSSVRDELVRLLQAWQTPTPDPMDAQASQPVAPADATTQSSADSSCVSSSSSSSSSSTATTTTTAAAAAATPAAVCDVEAKSGCSTAASGVAAPPPPPPVSLSTATGGRRRRGRAGASSSSSLSSSASAAGSGAGVVPRNKGVRCGAEAVLRRYMDGVADAAVVDYLVGTVEDAASDADPTTAVCAALESFVGGAAPAAALTAAADALLAEHRAELKRVAGAATPPATPLPVVVPPVATATAARAHTGAAFVAFPRKSSGAAAAAVEAAQEYDPCPYDEGSKEVEQLVALGVTVRRDIIARVLWRRCNGDMAAAATLLFEPDAEAKELAAIDAELARKAAEVERVKEDEKAKALVRRRILQQYDEQEDRTGHVHRPFVPGGVGVRGKKTKKRIEQKRFFDSKVVSYKGEKYFEAPKPERTGTASVGNYPENRGAGMKVITKGKRGVGFRMTA